MQARWTLADMPSLDGLRFLVTGANSGIGYYAALELARHGALVILACRDKGRGEAALARLRREAAGPGSAASDAELVELDLASLESVRMVAEAEVARSRPLHGLINNAAVMAPKRRMETKDGFELHWGTNVLGPFALTCRLMPALESARAARVEDAPRVVTIASIAHKRGKIPFNDLNAKQSYVPMERYGQSKLANLMFAFELERRLRAAEMGAISLAAHPGIAETMIFQTGEYSGLERAVRKVAAGVIGSVLNSGPQGALPTLYAATADAAVGGGYYGPQGLLEMRGGDVGEAQVSPRARDADVQKRLWELCEGATGVSL